MWLPTWFKKRSEARPNLEEHLRILVLSMSLDGHILLQRLGKQHSWEICFTNSPREAIGLASQSHFELILCDPNQPGYPWLEVMDRLAEYSPRSCILLVSPVRDDDLWRNVLQQGGYDVLLRPLREESALHAVHAVLRLFPQSEVSLSVVGNNRTQLRCA